MAAVLLAAGAGVLVLYALLDAANVGKIGEPTDIGGGLIRLLGYILLGLGVIRLVVDIRSGRSNH